MDGAQRHKTEGFPSLEVGTSWPQPLPSSKSSYESDRQKYCRKHEKTVRQRLRNISAIQTQKVDTLQYVWTMTHAQHFLSTTSLSPTTQETLSLNNIHSC